MNAVCGLAIAWDLRQVNKVLSLRGDLGSEVGAIVRTEGVAEDLYVCLVVQAGDALHQVGRGVVAEVRADVAHPQTTATHLQVLRVIIRWLVQYVYL